MNLHEKYIHRCVELAEKSHQKRDYFFGSLITYKDKIIVESLNTGKTDITGHAEVNAIKQLREKFPEIPFSECTLYSSFEPCAMCSLLIRDTGIGRVVFSARSPFWGGYSRWDILTTTKMEEKFTSCGKPTPPEVIPYVLEEETSKKLDALDWEMHHEILKKDLK